MTFLQGKGNNIATTCGDRYRAIVETLFPRAANGAPGLCALLHEAPGDAVEFAAFALGSMVGEASKVHLGACDAFMIRPAPEWLAWAFEALGLVCVHYGLAWQMDKDQGELWAFRSEQAIRRWQWVKRHCPVNSPEWHTWRALLCGIPEDERDPAYHTRQGYRVRCEPETP